MSDHMNSYTETRNKYKAALKEMRDELDNSKALGIPYGGSMESMEIILDEAEERERRINHAIEFMQSGGADSLGAAMSSDFARLRELGE